MRIKRNLLSATALILSAVVFSQIENTTNPIRIESTDTNLNSPTGLELPAVKVPNLTSRDNLLNNASLGEAKQDSLDMTKGDGLLEFNSGKAPKYFTKDKAISEDIGGDQHLGDIKTNAGTMNVQYRDHEYVDGDLIRVYVNDDIVQSSIYLSGSFQGFNLPLQSGINRIEFQALNQGSSGPNTAELHVYDAEGRLVSAYEWNLLTGDKASVIIIKE